MKHDIMKPELLAPAGNLATALTAFDNGADAVYAGLAKFNARERTENFSLEDMSKLSAYSKKIGKKFYLTLNTLVKEDELNELVSTISEVVKLQPDAVIVQDLGVLHILREYFPGTPIHASTQMAIHNSLGISTVKNMGVERVILERQVTTKELEIIVKKSELEVEVFVHGALCCSLSGNCMFSSWLGGWSGNRGKCKQPCRRRYFSKQGNGFFFSPQDLYSLDMIPKLMKMGLASLKIEGRLKKQDYVSRVVKAYRMMLDTDPDQQKSVLKEARAVLSDSLGRKWSHGFATEKEMGTLIQHENLGVSGLLCGNIKNRSEGGFNVNVNRRLHIGDRIRVQARNGDEGPAVTITKMSVGRHQVKVARKGETCFVHCDKNDIPPVGSVYKIGETVDEMIGRIDSLPTLKAPVDLDIKIWRNGIDVRVENVGKNLEWKTKIDIAEAEKKALLREVVEDSFRSSASDNFMAGNIKVSIDGKLFLPASVLKRVRRDFWNWLAEHITPEDIYTSSSTVLMDFYDDYNALAASPPEKSEVSAVVNKGDVPKKKGVLIARSIYQFNKKTDEAILPIFCPENRLDDLKRRIEEVYQYGVRRFRVCSLFAIELLKKYDDIFITASYPLPVTNSIAVKELKNIGFDKVQGWLELGEAEINNLFKKSILPAESYRFGRPALLATRAEIKTEGEIKDSRGNAFYVKKDPGAGITYIYPKEVMSIPRIENSSNFFDLTNARWRDEEKSSFNYEFSLV